MSKLVKNLNSDYMAKARAMAGRLGRDVRVVHVYVEGYDDIAFWRSVLSEFENEALRFEVNVPSRDDLAKGKKVLLSMVDGCGDDMILCMDSDFDYLFENSNAQSQAINSNKYIFQTYVYAIENYFCYPPALRSACVRATKNDTFIFDFEAFMVGYSRAVYDLFLWYVYSAYSGKVKMFPLSDFRNTVSLHFLDIEGNGANTLAWVHRNCERKLKYLEDKYHRFKDAVRKFEPRLRRRGVREDNVFLYMHGHTLLDNVVSVVLDTVCEVLKQMSIDSIRNSSREGITLANELSNYKNTLRAPEEVLTDSVEYRRSEPFVKLRDRVARYVAELSGEGDYSVKEIRMLPEKIEDVQSEYEYSPEDDGDASTGKRGMKSSGKGRRKKRGADRQNG